MKDSNNRDAIDDREKVELEDRMPLEEFRLVAQLYLQVKSGTVRPTDYCVSWPESRNGTPLVIPVPPQHIGKECSSLHRVPVPRR
jgi:hypothetical protein